MPKMKNLEKEKQKLAALIKEKESLRATLQKRVPILIKNNDSGLEDLYDQITKITVEIYNLGFEFRKYNQNG